MIPGCVCVFVVSAARGFGMRVVGGKTGADGRLFAYIVWTVPGGPAEKGGLQQGDKVNYKPPLLGIFKKQTIVMFLF